MTRTSIKSLLLFSLVGLTLWLGLWPLLAMLAGLGIEVPAHEQLWLLLVILALAGGLWSLLGASFYLHYLLRARILDVAHTRNEYWLLQNARQLAKRLGIPVPRIAIYDTVDLNAFAIGLGGRRTTVVLSSGILQGLQHDELECVLAHELSHIAKGDVQSLAILHGMLNLIIYLPARLLEKLVRHVLPGSRLAAVMYSTCVIMLQLVWGWLASLLIMRFSRYCEYRADRHAAHLVGLDKMRAALQCLNVMHATRQTPAWAAFGLTERIKHGFVLLFNSHPSLSARLAALRPID